jgi:hypothetical protein
MLGALLARKPLVDAATVEQVMRDKLGARKAHMLEVNRAALERGKELSLAQQTTV